jgi:hypothetical protein
MAERGRKGARTTETEGAKGEILSSRFSELSTSVLSHGVAQAHGGKERGVQVQKYGHPPTDTHLRTRGGGWQRSTELTIQ